MKQIDTLYLIDDDDTYRFIAKRTISSLNVVRTVRIFSNGKQAIEYLEDTMGHPGEIPDIILLDLNMPVMDGWDFLENFFLLKPYIGKQIHIYIVSSSINPEDMERARKISEVTDYIIKPLTKEKLADILVNIL